MLYWRLYSWLKWRTDLFKVRARRPSVRCCCAPTYPWNIRPHSPTKTKLTRTIYSHLKWNLFMIYPGTTQRAPYIRWKVMRNRSLTRLLIEVSRISPSGSRSYTTEFLLDNYFYSQPGIVVQGTPSSQYLSGFGCPPVDQSEYDLDLMWYILTFDAVSLGNFNTVEDTFFSTYPNESAGCANFRKCTSLSTPGLLAGHNNQNFTYLNSLSPGVSTNTSVTDLRTRELTPLVPAYQGTRLPRPIGISEVRTDELTTPPRIVSESMRKASSKRRTRVARHFCPYKNCTSSFTATHNLKYHMNSHEGIKHYSCKHQGCMFRATAPATAARHAKKCEYGRNAP
ncbi:hypothetical protein AX15_001895 [Amanita polypyramis BW_CC]|nr:hypothetical protein AX15_001895 [Amanita polypyramis BW_CC]